MAIKIVIFITMTKFFMITKWHSCKQFQTLFKLLERASQYVTFDLRSVKEIFKVRKTCFTKPQILFKFRAGISRYHSRDRLPKLLLLNFIIKFATK